MGVNMERFEFGQWLGLGAGFFCNPIWRNIVSSLLNKVCINSSTIGRHGGSGIDDWILHRCTRSFKNSVRAQTTFSLDAAVSRDTDRPVQQNRRPLGNLEGCAQNYYIDCSAACWLSIKNRPVFLKTIIKLRITSFKQYGRCPYAEAFSCRREFQLLYLVAFCSCCRVLTWGSHLRGQLRKHEKTLVFAEQD